MFNESVVTILSMIGLVHLVALISPGPDFAMILRSTVQNGKHYAMWAALGLAIGILFHVSYCLFGLSLLINSSPYIMQSVAIAGSLYLFYQGVKSIVFAFNCKDPQAELLMAAKNKNNIECKKSVFQAISNGFLTNVLNPKAFAYFLSFFAAAITNIKTLYMSILVAAEVFLLTLFWFTFLAKVISSKLFLTFMRKNNFTINFLIGTAFVFFSLSMIYNAIM